MDVYNDNRGLKATRCQRILTTLSFTLTNAQRRKRKVSTHFFWPLLKCGFSVVFRIRHGARSRQEHIVFLMRLNKYLFNRVNNKERERGQRSVVWLKRGQPCLHHLHVLRTVFSWRPFSSFSLWIIPPPPLPAMGA